MSKPQIVKSEKFSVDHVEYSDPKKLSHGGQAIYVNYNFTEKRSEAIPNKIRNRLESIDFLEK